MFARPRVSGLSNAGLVGSCGTVLLVDQTASREIPRCLIGQNGLTDHRPNDGRAGLLGGLSKRRQNRLGPIRGGKARVTGSPRQNSGRQTDGIQVQYSPASETQRIAYDSDANRYTAEQLILSGHCYFLEET